MYKSVGKRAEAAVLCFLLLFAGPAVRPDAGSGYFLRASASSDLLSELPAYSGDAYTVVNDNVPVFDAADFTSESFETYSELDAQGRCGAAYANLGQDLMPTEDRGDISSVYPTGWVQNEYDSVNGGYLYNRCHLIAYELAAENANEKNLITGTRYFNIEGMLPFENMIADYIKETGNHVLYRVTPIFEGSNLLASGVQMEAESVEDGGDGILFNVYCYNVQPGITIDYATGDNWASDESAGGADAAAAGEEAAAAQIAAAEEAAAAGMAAAADSAGAADGSTYILNTNTMKFHYSSCSYVDKMSDANRLEYTGSRDEIIAQGYDPCKWCNP